jgi:hypothetical protein
LSLAIDIDKVVAVLLTDGWHNVEGASFVLDSYEYVWHDDDDPAHLELVHGGGNSDVCATGFRFLERVDDVVERFWTSGPLTAILAVREVEVRSPK